MAFSYHSKTPCLAFVNIYKYSAFFSVTDISTGGEQKAGEGLNHRQPLGYSAKQNITAAAFYPAET